MSIAILGPSEQAALRRAGRVAAETLAHVASRLRPGISTADIDVWVREDTARRGGTPSQLGYHGFPAAVCTSKNHVVCHGIPRQSDILSPGDIVNVDVTPILDGFHGDASRTFLIGDVPPAARRLVQDTYTALWLGIAAVRPGGRTGEIGHAIQAFVEARGYSVVREFCGHGIGRVFHTAPTILHLGEPGTGERLLPGMTFTIEPMINLGDWRCRILDDGWTAVTADASLSAQFEHTVLVTDSGVDVLTLGRNERPPALSRVAAIDATNRPG